MASAGSHLPPSQQAQYPENGMSGANGAHNGYNGAPYANNGDAYSQPTNTSKGTKRSGRFLNLLLAALLAVSVALAAAPAAGYKSGWAYYRRHNYQAPARFQIPVPVTLRIWVGYVKGTNSLTNQLHAIAPQRFREFTYLRDVRESGQVIAGLAIAFLLVSAIVGFLYFIACLFYTIVGRKVTADAPPRSSTAPAGLWLAAFIFGFLNMAWSIVCYIVIAVGTAIYTRRNLQATYVCWPDWCFWLGFFSGVFWLIAGGVAFSGRKRRNRAAAASPNMTHNMSYGKNEHAPAGAYYNEKPRSVV